MRGTLWGLCGGRASKAERAEWAGWVGGAWRGPWGPGEIGTVFADEEEQPVSSSGLSRVIDVSQWKANIASWGRSTTCVTVACVLFFQGLPFPA